MEKTAQHEALCSLLQSELCFEHMVHAKGFLYKPAVSPSNASLYPLTAAPMPSASTVVRKGRSPLVQVQTTTMPQTL